MKVDIETILKSSTENIATFIAANKMFNTFKQETKLCMIELMKRKAAGDEFDFQKHIDNIIKSNNINLNLKPYASVKQQISSIVTDAMLNVNRGDIEEEEEE